MPTVRRYGPRQVGLEPLPGVRKHAAETPQSQGIGVAIAKGRTAQALAGVGAQLGAQSLQIYQDFTERADDTLLLEGHNQLAQWKQQRLYDGPNAALHTKGKAAMPIVEEVSTEYEQRADAIAQGMNDRQRARFARVRAEGALELNLTLRRHVFGEIQAYEQKETTAAIANLTNEAITAALDPPMIDRKLGALTTLIKKQGPRLGLGPEAVDEAVRTSTSAVHVGVIDRLLASQNTVGAKIYFDDKKKKGEIAGDVIDDVERAVTTGTLRGEAQKQRDAILAAGGTFDEQRAKAKSLPPVEGVDQAALEEETLKLIEHEQTVRDRVDREKKEKDLGDAMVIVDRTGTTTAVPPALWERVVREGHGRALEAWAESKAAGVEPKTDWRTYYALMDQAGSDPQTFVTQDIYAYRHKLGDVEFKSLTNLKLDLQQGNRAHADDVLRDHRSETAVVNESLALVGIDPEDKTKQLAVTYLRRRVGEMSAAFIANTGKKPTNPDIQTFVDTVMQQPHTTPGSWWNLLVPGAKVSDVKKSLLEVTIADVPAQARKDIEAVLRKKGEPVNDTSILRLYIADRDRTQPKKPSATRTY